MDKPTKPEPNTRDIEAVRHFKQDGKDVRPGDRLRVAVADAVELVEVGAAAYARRDLRAKG
jgi:hypothetical protein